MTSRRPAIPLVAAGTAVLAVSALLRWWSVRYQHPLLGERLTTLTGREAVPALLVLAAVAAAGLGAALAARGLIRRLVGVLLAAAGVVVAVATVSGARDLPAAAVQAKDSGATGLPVTVFTGSVDLWGPALAGLGAGLVVAGGVLIVVGRAGRGLAGRFDRTGTVTRPAADPDADAAEMWKRLSSGEDPTSPH